MRDNKGRFIKENKEGFKKGNKLWNNFNSKKTQFKKGSSGFNRKHTDITKEKIRVKKKGQRVSFKTEFKKGMKPWNKGIGKSSEEIRIRKSIEYNLWRNSILARDNWTCQKTGQRGGKLQVHHINNFKDYPELRLAIDNGITLTIKSHKKFHKIYGVKNNTKEQLLEYLNNND